MFTGSDSNSRQRHFQTGRQQTPQRLICAVVDRRRGQTNLQPIPPFTRDFVTAGSRLHSHRKAHRAVFFFDLHEVLCLRSRAEQRCPYPNLGRALFNCNFKVVRHPHRKDRQQFPALLRAQRGA